MSLAALVQCSDGRKYVIKRCDLGRPLCAEHVVGRLGLLIGAPCMEVALADVTPQLIALDPKLQRFAGGLAHATVNIDNVAEHRGVQHQAIPQNRPRFASLLVLYSWMCAADHQFMYEVASPHLVYSHDHGCFFHGAQAWTPATLAAGVAAALDGPLSAIGLSNAEIKAAAVPLAAVTDAEIAQVLAPIPAPWGVPSADLLALGQYLRQRRDAILAIIGGLP